MKGLYSKKRPYEHFIIEQVDKILLSKGLKLDSINPDMVLMYDARIERNETIKQPSQITVSVRVYTPYYYGGSYFDPDGYRNAYPATAPAGNAYYGGYFLEQRSN